MSRKTWFDWVLIAIAAVGLIIGATVVALFIYTWVNR